MPLSIGPTASHVSIAPVVTPYDYPANKLEFESVTHVSGLSSGGHNAIVSEKCRFPVEQGYWYKIKVGGAGPQKADCWYLHNYIGWFEDKGSATCNFGACPTTGPWSGGSLGTFYFFAPYSVPNAVFAAGAPYGSGGYRGTYSVELWKQKSDFIPWTLQASVASIPFNFPNTTVMKELFSFYKEETVTPFLIAGRVSYAQDFRPTPVIYATLSGMSANNGFVSSVVQPTVVLPTLPAVFENIDQLHSGFWQLSGAMGPNQSFDLFLFTKV